MTIYEIIGSIKDTEEIDFNTDFIESGLFDSLEIMTLVEELEKQYGCKIRGTDILPQNFADIETIRELVKKSGGSMDE